MLIIEYGTPMTIRKTSQASVVDMDKEHNHIIYSKVSLSKPRKGNLNALSGFSPCIKH